MKPWHSVLFLLALLALPLVAQAEEYIYAPDDCEFSVTFPDEPYISERCDPSDPTRCERVTSFTRVYDLDATLSFNVVCKPLPPNAYDRFTQELMRTTVIAMSRAANLEGFDTDFSEVDGTKIAILIGTGVTSSGRDDIIYTSQFWVGQRSSLTLEAEVRGSYVEEADALFAHILQSVSARGNHDQGE